MAYHVETLGNCKIVHGDLPLDEVGRLIAKRDGVYADALLAERLGAALVFGSKEDLARLRAMDLPPSQLTAAESEAGRRQGLSPEALQWIANGEQGLSSRAMFTHLTGVCVLRGVGCAQARERTAVPRDSDDFARCRLLLEQVPELAPRLPLMASLSDEWAALVRLWDRICVAIDEDTPSWRQGRRYSKRASQMIAAALMAARNPGGTSLHIDPLPRL